MLSPEEEREEEVALQQIAAIMAVRLKEIARENAEALERHGLPPTVPPIPEVYRKMDWSKRMEEEPFPSAGLPVREAEVFPDSERRPALVVIAGPNGSGKTSMTEQCLRMHHPWLEGCLYINPDTIARERFGDWNDPSAVLKAAQLAKQRRWEALDQRQSFAFETVFSTPEKVNFLREARARGYFIRFLFVGTDSPFINVSRIALRTMKGGHSVDIGKVVARYERAMRNARLAIPLADRAYVYDNSITLPAGEPKVWSPLFRTERGILSPKYQRPSLPWAQALYDALIS